MLVGVCVQVVRETVDRLGVDLSVQAAVTLIVKEKAIKPAQEEE